MRPSTTPVTSPPRWIAQLSAASALGGALVTAALFVLGGPAGDPLSLAIATAALVILPLGLLALPRGGSEGGPPRPGHAERLLAIAAVLQPIGGACVLASLALPPGRSAGLFAAAWMPLCLLSATLGVARLARAGLRDAAEVCAAGALLYLPVGAAWLLAWRMGLPLLGFGSILVALTAIHFHFAAFAAPLLAARTIAALDGAPRRIASAAGIALLAAQPIVAVGITASAPLALAGAVLLAAGLLAASALVLGVVQRRARSRLARALLVASAITPFASMPLAIAWSLAEAGGPRLVGLEDMVRWHGTANAYGLALLGLAGWAVEDRAWRRAEAP